MAKFTVIVGPCIIESETFALDVAQELKKQLARFSEIDFYFKSSFDKANRTSVEGFRGPGLRDGLKILSKVKEKTGFSLLTDFHTPDQALPVAEVVDFLQIPAFLCRQTDMIQAGVHAACRFERKLNVKKGQFLAPWDAKNIIEKMREFHAAEKSQLKNWMYLTERGVSFGYNNLIVDMSSFQTIQKFNVPVIYDCTHSVQIPGAAPGGKSTGGKRENIEVLARAAVAAGASGIFLECHPNPDKAKSDGPNAFYLDKVGTFIGQMLELHSTVKKMEKVLPESNS